jgi:hypothetical protein
MKKLLSTNDWLARHPVCIGAIMVFLYILASSL